MDAQNLTIGKRPQQQAIAAGPVDVLDLVRSLVSLGLGLPAKFETGRLDGG